MVNPASNTKKRLDIQKASNPHAKSDKTKNSDKLNKCNK